MVTAATGVILFILLIFIFYASVAVDSVHIMKLLKKTELLYLDEQRSTTTIQTQVWKWMKRINLSCLFEEV